ncbi:MAG: lycopene cyclase domain-containing protein, partial [Flavobacteriaceae bacterium]|nr:lycopene cyclase domain-containing protein [Flavobacteriaceae bacterium]
MAFYRHIKKLILPLILVSGGFLVWDHWFTSMEVWGFNTN